MLNILWGAMIIIGVITAAFTGRVPQITTAALDSAKEAVALCVTMLGIMSMWTGLMKIAEESGIIGGLTRRMRPMIKFLFPRLDPRGKAVEHISTNIIANVLGLGWAATPAGIKAMKELQKINEKKDTASREMCMFMIFNMSSLQIISMNLIAYRAQYDSSNPSEIIGPGLFATIVTTVVGVVSAKIFEFFNNKKSD